MLSLHHRPPLLAGCTAAIGWTAPRPRVIPIRQPPGQDTIAVAMEEDDDSEGCDFLTKGERRDILTILGLSAGAEDVDRWDEYDAEGDRTTAFRDRIQDILRAEEKEAKKSGRVAVVLSRMFELMPSYQFNVGDFESSGEIGAASRRLRRDKNCSPRQGNCDKSPENDS